MSQYGNISPLPKEMALLAISEINVLSAKAYSDAAIGMAPQGTFDGEFDIVEKVIKVAEDFALTNYDKILNNAFDALSELVNLRSSEGISQENLALQFAALGVRIDAYQAQLQDLVGEEKLPIDCLEHFQSALHYASAENRSEWKKVLVNRREATGDMAR